MKRKMWKWGGPWHSSQVFARGRHISVPIFILNHNRPHHPQIKLLQKSPLWRMKLECSSAAKWRRPECNSKDNGDIWKDKITPHSKAPRGNVNVQCCLHNGWTPANFLGRWWLVFTCFKVRRFAKSIQRLPRRHAAGGQSVAPALHGS